MQNISKEEILAQRFYNQGLIKSYSDLDQLLKDSLGIQSQYLNHGLFNMSTRLNLLNTERVEETLEPAILGWGQRQTYHFYNWQTWQEMGQFLKADGTWTENYFASENLDLVKECQELREHLTQPLTRTELSQRYGQRWAKLFNWSALFIYNSRKGKLYQKWQPNDRLVVWSEKVIPKNPELPKKILESYFNFYGPASLADAVHFFGIKQSQISENYLAGLKRYDYQGRTYYSKYWQEEAQIPEVLVLGKFDPLLISYKHKDILIDKADQGLVWKKAGQISALILIKGNLKGTWTFSVKGSAIDFKVLSAKKISLKHQASIRRIFRKYTKWMGKTMRQVEFHVE
ncbi:Winged helix DNA-binding domain-containing protein [Streptococcus henryi]|uniref:Winged helix DNA-binding domain-containing protein n=1 Tax=Streptococcus henryi TaxID=439219 RepID=A0A1G6C167_9STRE|nr:crosslink repair DNA glycosylase YcaQ family protein [Streptococcus henryi]SDB26606.1 Winged helix DNA-binding domain-containing protein [Streptococcus henryi]